MKLLPDTHAVLWFIEGDLKLSAKARELIENPRNEIYVSVTSFFEISIKLKLGKLSLQKSLNLIFQDITDAYIQVLPISNAHLLEYQNVPLINDHRDPYDRMLVATAVAENAGMISIDQKFENYLALVNVIW
ncbi:type II toxin-antitoxin system VapC family toxin [Dyadobacter frigoris]|uniref:Type II toxin-antitoxin system VapC family toxin n=1 Tax=Dyadobacter frigoris TaxID=2576211 RepID=A0A4U6D8T1_9BACT|nr:type II toxin-antitoxin system VapC family toxin [Dyadobacter frigoris]TKT92518.1 type II toxin-antitoxin system VapC family toxin [Dyadobacter frigoris]GLU55312.1 twitching motility protein PilT [Dyadobacter frigoris]